MARVWLPPQSDPWLALREPALLVPGRKPVGRLKLKENHPLARGIISVVVGGIEVDLKNNNLIAIGTNTSNGIEFERTADGNDIDTGSIFPALFDYFSSFSIYTPTLISGAARHGIWTAGARGLGHGFANPDRVFAYPRSTAGDYTLESGAGVLALNTKVSIGYSYSNVSPETLLYKNGVFHSNLTKQSSGSDSASTVKILSQNTSGINDGQGKIEINIIWINRLLTAAEHASLAADPYQLFEPAANEPIFIGTAGGATGTTVTLNSDSLVITDGTLTVTAQEDTVVSLTADTLSITDGSLSVQADVDTNVTLAGDALTIADGSLTTNVETDVTLVGDSLTIADGSLGIFVGDNTVVSLTPSTLTITDGTLGVTVGNDVTVSLTPDTITITDGTLAISAAVDTVVTMVGDTLTISEGTLNIQADVDTTITLAGDTITITDGSLGVDVVRTINLVPDTLTITDGTLGVSVVQDTTVNLSADTLTITDGSLVVTSSITVTLEMVYNKLLEIEALIANHSGPIGATEEVILTTNYASVGLYWDGTQYQVI